jgi:hypothetical protein
MKHKPFPVRNELHDSGIVAALVVTVLAEENQIDGYQHPTQSPLKQNGFVVTADRHRFYQQQVEIVRERQIASID